MRPLIWTDWRAATGVAGLVGWLICVEVGTSRTSSRGALHAIENRERVEDTATGALFDGAAATALIGGLAASLTAPKATIRARRASLVAGLGLLVVSGLSSWVARKHLGQFHRHSLTVHTDHEVVDSGPYGVIRHPLYAATIGVFAGIGASLGNWLSLGFTALLPTLALVRRISVEEHMLTNALGAEYTTYCQRTSRLLPGIW